MKRPQQVSGHRKNGMLLYLFHFTSLKVWYSHGCWIGLCCLPMVVLASIDSKE